MSASLKRAACPRWIGVLIALCICGFAGDVLAQTLPKISLQVEDAQQGADAAVSLQIIFLLTILSLAPSILIMMTSFTRIVIVLSFLRTAIGTQQMPPNQLLVGLSLFLTFFVMAPVWERVNDEAIQPLIEDEIPYAIALDRAMEPIREFMLKQTRQKDMALFVRMAHIPQPRNYTEIPNTVLIPSFIISELRTAFQIGFILFIPFLVIDLVVASILLSMGMMMLPPVMVSLPFKILLFVLVDGWNLLIQSLVKSFH
ncbi:MAG: flagellar type III secretion system pore protein FliP [Candidatus Latescibacterota bacterium]|jgi:flagellar biosynthetic protein FliP|tara:strand:+ start:130 stop:900 length:771 start_codon:yes stop_codon:yes gene_type:complete